MDFKQHSCAGGTGSGGGIVVGSGSNHHHQQHHNSSTNSSGGVAPGAANGPGALLVGNGPSSSGNSVNNGGSTTNNNAHQSNTPSVVPSSLGLSPSQSSADSQQFNIFPAIFSRQLNFTSGSCGQGKLMDELRPNLVGGLLGLQQGLLEDHALSHSNLQHSNQDTKFMSFQDNRLMGLTSTHENRLLGLSSAGQDGRSPSITSVDKNSSINHRKCSSTPEDFSSLYSGLPTPGMDHHTPSHTPPTRLSDHSLSGKYHFYKRKTANKKSHIIAH